MESFHSLTSCNAGVELANFIYSFPQHEWNSIYAPGAQPEPSYRAGGHQGTCPPQGLSRAMGLNWL